MSEEQILNEQELELYLDTFRQCYQWAKGNFNCGACVTDKRTVLKYVESLNARIKQLEQERQEMISAFGEIVTMNIIDSNDLMQTAMMLKIPARRIIFKFNLEPFLQPPKEEGK